MALTITVTTAGRAALLNASKTGTAAVTIAQVGISATAVVPSAAATALPGESKRIATISGDVVAADTIHLIVRDESTAAFTVRSFALYLADGTLFAIYGQSDPILEKSAQAMMLLAIDVQFADITAAQLTFGNANFLNPPATTSVQGVIEIATEEETTAGVDTQRAVVPKFLKSAVTGWINSRFGDGAPSAFVKTLLTAASAAAMRLLLGLKSAALKDEGAGNGLDADTLDTYHASAFGLLGANNLWTGSNSFGAATFGGAVTISSTAPRINMSETDTGKLWIIAGDNSAWSLREDTTSGSSSRIIVNPGSLLLNLGSTLTWGGSNVWTAANDGAGSGLDADLLDGQDSTYYTNIIARLGYSPLNRAGDVMTTTTEGADLLTLSSPTGNIAFRPNGTTGAVIRVGGSGSGANRLRILGVSEIELLDIATNTFNWRGNTVWHAGNDGAGSGLDADLLDGKQGRAYALLDGSTEFSGSLRVVSANAALFKYSSSSNPTLIQRIDGSSFYFLLSDASTAISATFNSLRPFRIDLLTGLLASNNGQTFAGGTTVTGSLTLNGSGVWTAGNDGAGSGMDADLLDGQEGSWYADILSRLGFTPVQQGGGTGQGTNKIRLGWSGSRLKAQVDASDLGNVVFDTQIAGMWTSANDGSGSGLDADLLDGYQAAAFLRDLGVNLASTGYQRLSNGLIMQWGIAAGSYTANAEIAVTYPLAFPTGTLMVMGTNCDVNTQSAAMVGVSYYNPPTVTGFRFRTNVGGQNRFHWIAIGY